MLNIDGGMIVRQLAQILAMATFKRKKQTENPEFDGPHAISDELLSKCRGTTPQKLRSRARKSRESSFRIDNERPISAKESLETFQLSRSHSKTILISARTKELLQSKSMIQLTKSNVIPSETSEQRLRRITKSINSSKIKFSERMDDIIITRLEQQKEQICSFIARKTASTWIRRFRFCRATTHVISSRNKPKLNTKKLSLL